MSVSASNSMFAGGGGFGTNPKPTSPKYDGREDWRHAENNEPEDFSDSKQEIMFTTTMELEKKINRAFRMIFSDYHGCTVEANPTGERPLKVDLYFQPRRKEAYAEDELETRAFVQVKESLYNNENGSLANSVFAATQTNRQNNRQFILTDYASEVLFDFLLPRVKGGNNGANPFNPDSYIRNNLVTETINQVNMNQFIVCCINAIDIGELLKFIYGHKDHENSNLMYNVYLQGIKKDGAAVMNNEVDWIVSIVKMSSKQFNSIKKTLGIRPATGSLRINTTV